MNKIQITEVNGILNIIYNDQPGRFQEYSRNLTTGFNVALLADEQGVETSILCQGIRMYDHSMFDDIKGTPITDNQILFDELEKLL